MARRSLALAALAACCAACPSSPERASDPEEMVWASAWPLGPLEPDSGTFGLLALAQPLVHTPLGSVAPAADSCGPKEPCTLHVPEGLVDQEGEPLDAAVLAASLRHQLERYPAHPASGASVEVMDTAEGQALRIVLDEVTAPMLPHLVVSPHRQGRWIGTGPYLLVDSGPKLISLEAVEPRGRRPSRVRIEKIESERRVLGRFLEGSVDFALVSPQILRLLETAGVVGDSMIGGSTDIALLLNVRDPALEPLSTRRCMLAEIGAALQGMRERAHLDGAVLAPHLHPRTEACRLHLDRSLPEVLVVELMSGVEGLALAHEAALSVLARTGRRLEIRWIEIEDIDRPLVGHLRVAGWNPRHPSFPRAWLETGARFNAGGHCDPELDRLMAGGATIEELSRRLSEVPSFIPIGALPQAIVTSRRFHFDQDLLQSGRDRWVGLAIRAGD